MLALSSRPQPRPSSLERAIVALVRAEATRNTLAPADPIDAVDDDRVAKAIVERAAQTLGSTSVAGWSAELVNVDVVGQFFGSLAPLSAGAALIAKGLTVPLTPGVETESLPARNGLPSTTPNWVGQGGAIPVTAFTLTGSATLTPKKFATIAAITREVARRANGEAIIRALLRENASAALDGALFATSAGSASAHAGMLNGVSALTGYAGADEGAAVADMLALTDVISPGGSGQITFVVSPKRYARLTILRRKWTALADLQFLASIAVPDDRIIGIDAPSWIYAFGGDAEIDASYTTALHLESSPTDIVTGGSPASGAVKSLWQVDAIAFRMLCDVAFAPRRANAISYVDAVTW